MSVIKIVRAKGGTLYANGTRALIPAPGHSAKDRSVSIMMGHSGRVIVHSFGGTNVREILTDLRASGLIDAHGFCMDGPQPEWQPPARLSDAARSLRAVDLWSQSQPLPGTPAATYLRYVRAINRPIEAISGLRYLADCPLSAYEPQCRRTQSALLARITDPNGNICGIEITYLTQAGRRDFSVKTSRKIIGTVPPGAAVHLDPVTDQVVVGEGVMPVLSATERFGLPGLAFLSVNNLLRLTPPAGLGKLIIAADRGRAGEAGALALFDRLKPVVAAVEIVLPSEPYDDFNSWAQALQKEKGRAGAGDV